MALRNSGIRHASLAVHESLGLHSGLGGSAMHSGTEGRIGRLRRTAGAFAAHGMLVLSAGLAGCGTASAPNAPQAPGGISPLAIERAWPHEDGRSFPYRYVARQATPAAENRFASASDVPAVGLELVAALLGAPPPFDAASETTLGYVLAFDDSATTGSGVRGQNLTPSFTVYPFPTPLRAGTAFTAPLGDVLEPPLFLGGGIWRMEPGRIARYGDDSTEPIWLYLAGALADRSVWEAGPLPGAGAQTILRARAYQSVTVDIANVRADDALDVHYLLDHGVDAVAGSGGLEYRRRFSYGRVVWARDAGPLYLFERRGLTAGSPPTQGVAEATLLLEDLSSPAFVGAATLRPPPRATTRPGFPAFP
jgi:hypothetical protein